MAKVILFDITSKGEHPRSWSYNVCKVRSVLNFKEIPYETEWLEYPDIAPTLQAFGIPPGEDIVPYTCPAVQFKDDGTYLMDSTAIVTELERRFPSPSLHLDSPYVKRVPEILTKAYGPLRPELLFRTMTNVLAERSREYFERTRAEWFSMPLSQVAAEKGGEIGWEKARPGFNELADMLKEHPEGPFLMGEQVCYADFLLVTIMNGCRRADEKYLFERILSFDESFVKLWKACEKWLAKED